MLAAAGYLTQQGSNSNRRKEERTNQLHEAMETLAAEGNTAPTYAEIGAVSGIRRNTATRLVEASGEYTVDRSERAHRVVRRMADND
jgi:DNA-directed RNA polymerase specialized sigma subunit